MSETLTDSLLGRVIDGRYEVRERIASGGMATVYLALDRRLERLVAIKVMHVPFSGDAERTDFVARFRREAKSAARLTHPGMVRVYDQGTDGDVAYLTMEYVGGENLRARLRHESTLPVGEALGLVEAILDALAAAHRQGLVHRDVKPENILIDEDGFPKLTDFGLARAATEVTATSTGTVMGTVAYMAPETTQRGEADQRSDVYSAGILLFEALTGRQPFTAASAVEVAARHVHEDVPPPSQFIPWLPAELDELVAALTARTPQARPADATAALSIVRRTRAMIDDPTLDRRADPPSGAVDVGGADATAVIDMAGRGSTIALPLGVGGPLPLTGEIAIIDEDPAAYNPPHGRKRILLWIGASLAAAVVLLGLGSWWYTTQGPGAYTTVPAVENLTADQAQRVLEAAGLEVVTVQAHDNVVAEGLVVSSIPGGQEQIARGGTVTITVSKGPRLESVPSVKDLSREDAQRALEDAGFSVGSEEGVFDDLVAEGHVISTSPGTDEVVTVTTPITVTYSKGPQPITIPDVIGQPEQQARDQLEQNYALVVTVVRDTTMDVEPGEVFRTDPEPGAASSRTAAITIYVSEGRPLVEVPSFAGMSVDQAEAAARDLNLLLDWQPYGNIPWMRRERVADQDPAFGTTVEMGSTVIVYYANK